MKTEAYLRGTYIAASLYKYNNRELIDAFIRMNRLFTGHIAYWPPGLLALLFCFAPFLQAESPRLTASDVQQQTLAWAKQSESFTQSGLRVELAPGKMDSRLSFSACETPLLFESAMQQARASRTLVKVRCKGPQPWAIFVPIEVKRYKQVVIASQPLTRGQIITPTEIEVREMAVATSTNDAFESLEDATGLVLKRNLRTGDVVRAIDLKQPKIVKRGDEVIIEARAGSISVKAPGTALSDGYRNQQINVKNNLSNRVIKAKVVAAGKVTALM